MPIGRLIAIVFLLCILLAAVSALPSQVVEAVSVGAVQDASQTEATTTKARIGLILGNLLILSLYGFPMSIGEGWALADPTKDDEEPKTEPPDSLDATKMPGNEAQASTDDWATMVERLPTWMRKPQGIPAGLIAGVCLTVVVVLLGAGAFALYYHFSGQPEKIGQILPRFAYWLPFALLGLITDVPFEVFDWEDRRLRVLLRLVIWWLPRIVILAFALNLPVLQDLDPVATALTVLAIDGALVVFFLWLHASRERIPSVLR